MPGHPSAKHLYLAELQRRHLAGEMDRSVGAEARALHSWFKANHPERNPGAERSIENNIRDRYRELKAQIARMK